MKHALPCRRPSAAALSASRQQDPGEAAWTLRRCFDDILDGRLDVAARVPPGAPEVTILNFEAGLPLLPRWSSVDDGVMGGLSSSTLTWDAHEQAAVFKVPDEAADATAHPRELTTSNNGGFASVRSSAWAGYAALSGAHGVRLLVRGDGRTYKLSAKADDGYDGVMYQVWAGLGGMLFSLGTVCYDGHVLWIVCVRVRVVLLARRVLIHVGGFACHWIVVPAHLCQSSCPPPFAA
eukprot:352986-Chlamydomonas_euryale.AAC.15